MNSGVYCKNLSTKTTCKKNILTFERDVLKFQVPWFYRHPCVTVLLSYTIGGTGLDDWLRFLESVSTRNSNFAYDMRKEPEMLRSGGELR